MPQNNFNPALSILETPAISSIRRNHGLEHAVLHILAKRFPGRPLAGHSNPNGFWILGNVPTADLEQAVTEALSRLKAGETELAVHPNCGTNFVVAGLAAGTAGALAMFGAGKRFSDKLGRLPLAVTLSTLALILAQPLGKWFQEHLTTSGDPGPLHVVRIVRSERGRIKAHKVITAD